MSAMGLNTPTYLLACTTTSAGITLSPSDANQSSLVIYNAGTAMAFLVSGSTAPTAVVPTAGNPKAGKPIPPGAVVTYSKNTTDAYLAAITAAGSTDIYISVGCGE